MVECNYESGGLGRLFQPFFGQIPRNCLSNFDDQAQNGDQRQQNEHANNNDVDIGSPTTFQ